HRRRRDEQGRLPEPAAAVVDPEGEVEKDPGAAREREQREDEADERRIDAERRREPAAHAGDNAVLAAPLERQHRDLRHWARTTSTRPAPTLATIARGLPESTRTWAFLPSSCRPSTCTSPAFAFAFTVTGTPRGTTMRRCPMPTLATTGVCLARRGSCERSTRRAPTPS